jgi:hypothetical protein
MSWFSGVWGGCGHSESIRNVYNYYKPLENRPTCPGCIINTTPGRRTPFRAGIFPPAPHNARRQYPLHGRPRCLTPQERTPRRQPSGRRRWVSRGELGYVNLLNASTDQGVGTELVEPMGTLLDRAIAAGLADGDISALIALLGKEPVART